MFESSHHSSIDLPMQPPVTVQPAGSQLQPPPQPSPELEPELPPSPSLSSPEAEITARTHSRLTSESMELSPFGADAEALPTADPTASAAPVKSAPKGPPAVGMYWCRTCLICTQRAQNLDVDSAACFPRALVCACSQLDVYVWSCLPV